MVNPAVFLLSGLIEWRLLRRETAETEFQEALKMDFGQCEAAYYLGGVRAELRKLPEALAAINQARQCYDLALAVRRSSYEDAMAKAVTPEARARESARHERAIASGRSGREKYSRQLNGSADASARRQVQGAYFDTSTSIRSRDRTRPTRRESVHSESHGPSCVTRTDAKARQIEVVHAHAPFNRNRLSAPIALSRSGYKRRDGQGAVAQRNVRRRVR
jgi:tetratricopeptide (TPR) repeat protein